MTTLSRADQTLEVGLVGAGPWAAMVHAPMLAAGPRTRLAAVWARRPEAAELLAAKHGAVACTELAELFDRCDAVAFAVPPAVQAELATQAAELGKAVLLEKPIADDVAGATRLVDAITTAGVASAIVLTWRYTAAVRSFLADVPAVGAFGGRGHFVSGALLGPSPFATPWRLERGPLLDLGPHVVDLLDAALGPVTGVQARGDRLGWVGLLLDHAGGTTSEVSLCATTPVNPHNSGVEIYGTGGRLAVDTAAAVGADTFRTVVDDFAAAVLDGTPHPLDAARGLHLQKLLATADAQLR
jgi:predicted dehydrogenase